MSKDDAVGTFRVLLDPAGVEFAAEAGETVMAAATRAGLRWPTVCRGLAQCGVCHIEVLVDNCLPDPAAEERGMLRRVVVRPLKGGCIRLACRLTVQSDLHVDRKSTRL